MKVQLDSSIAPIAPNPPRPRAPTTRDSTLLSAASTVLNQLSANRVSAAVQQGAYQTSSAAISKAIIDHALS